MPTICCVVCCAHRGGRDNVSFYRIPSVITKSTQELIALSEKRRQSWLQAICRRDMPEETLKYKRVCSIHFISGKPAPLENETDPDWVPSQRMGYGEKKNHTVICPNQRKAARPGNRGRKVLAVDPDVHSLDDSGVIKKEITDDPPFKAQPPQCHCCICYKSLPQPDAINTEGSQFGQVFFSLLKVEPSSLLSNFCCPSCGEDVMESFEATLDISISAMLTSRRSLGKSLAEALDEGCVRCGSVFPTVEELTDHFTDHVLEDCKEPKKNAGDNADTRKVSGYSSIPSKTQTPHAMSAATNLPKLALFLVKPGIFPNKPSARNIHHSSGVAAKIENDGSGTDSAPESKEPPITMKPRCIGLKIDKPTFVAPKPTEDKSTQVMESCGTGSNCEKRADTASKSTEEPSPQVTVDARDIGSIIDNIIKLNQKTIGRFDIKRSLRETKGGLVDDKFPYTLKYGNDLRSLLKDEHCYNKQKISRITEQSFLCYLCGKKYSTRQLMKKHYRQHDTGRLPTTPPPRKSPSVKSTKPRNRRKKGDPPRPRGRPKRERKEESQPTVATLIMYCNDCNDAFDDRSKLLSHMEMHQKNITVEGAEAGEVRVWVCRLCNRKLTSTVAAHDHRLYCRRKLVPIHLLKCQICERFYGDKEKLRRHIVREHPDSRIEYCLNCRQNVYDMSLLDHVIYHCILRKRKRKEEQSE